MCLGKLIPEVSAFTASAIIFAIHSFAQAEKNGRSTDDSVPFLSVYLGHHDMDETEKYLKFNGDMFPEYMGLFEDYATGVFTEAAYEEK